MFPIRALCSLSLLASLPGQTPPPDAAAAATAATPATVSVTGRVLAFDGVPVVGAAVSCGDIDALVTADVLKSPAATTDASGQFSFTTTVAEHDLDRLRLHIAAKGMASVTRSLDLHPAANAQAADSDANEPDAAAAAVPAPARTVAIGDLVLTAGQQLFGRARDESGQAIAGVRVVARDFLETGNAFRSGTHHGFHCAALSNASGIFHLPCALPAGIALEFSADGYGRQWLQPAAAGTPLEVTMAKTGWIQGRVLDTEGHSIEHADVTVNYELRAPARVTVTGADGGFRIPLERPGRWRIQTTLRTDALQASGHSRIFTGPQENLEILLETEAVEATTDTIAIRAVTRDGAVPVLRFLAAVSWEEYAARNLGFREFRLRSLLQAAAPAVQGVAQVSGPGKSKTEVGILRVIADGFAPATVLDLPWQQPEPDQAVEPVVVELDPEATISGVVRDELSGKPIAGATVWADLKPRPNEGSFSKTPRQGIATKADGSFTIDELGEGEWQVFVDEPGHPETAPTDVELTTGEHRTDLTITMPSGATVRGRLEGIELGAGAHVFLAPIPRQVFGANMGSYYGNRRGAKAEERSVPVAADGGFEFTGVPLDNHLLVVRLPSEPRRGGDLYLPVEPFRVRAAGIDGRFDCSQDQPGRLAGRITFAHADTAFENLVVIAVIAANGQITRPVNPYNQSYPGPRSFVEPDGRFSIRVGPGTYALMVVDLRTAIALHCDDEPIEVATGKSVERDIALELARLDLRLQPAAAEAKMAAVERIEVRFVPKTMKAQLKAIQGNDRYDSRGGLLWSRDTTTQSIVLPEGTVVLLARNEVAQLRTDQQKWQNEPLGRAEFEISLADGAVRECNIEVGAEPAIPGEAGEGENGNGDEPGKVDEAGEAIDLVAPAAGGRKR
ncbi:MAG: carboxypeptidase regulatory-like domain-containing protein [Planctomycetes bacterium]|nr:carboxypeptidase regulatory-like domain-containing protein [Planctomycetota bacterium]